MIKKLSILLLVSVASILLPALCYGSGSILMFNPVRIAFDDQHRSAKVTISNPTDQATPYTLSLVTLRRGADGKLVEPETETEREKLSRQLIRFSPRRSIIEPGTRQVVKLMVRKPRDLPVGEYQTRLKVTPLPLPENMKKEQPNNGGRFQVSMIVGATIPVIVQHGIVPPKVIPLSVDIDEHEQAKSGLAAKVTLSRKGEGSAFGDVLIYHIPAGSKTEQKLIGQARGVAIYLPTTERLATVLLKNVSRAELTSGTIKVEFHPNLPGQKQRKKKGHDMLSSREFPL